MRNFLYALRSPKRSLCGTLLALSTFLSPQTYAYECSWKQVELKDISFGLAIGKLIEKIKKYKTKLNQEKVLELMIAIKIEIEGYTGEKINLDKALDEIEKEMQKGGAKLKKGEFKELRTLIKNVEKRANHKALYMANCLSYQLNYDVELEQLMYTAQHGSDQEETKLPLKLTTGVAIALCGHFLNTVPITICQANSSWIRQAGVSLAIDGTVKR